LALFNLDPARAGIARNGHAWATIGIVLAIALLLLIGSALGSLDHRAVPRLPSEPAEFSVHSFPSVAPPAQPLSNIGRVIDTIPVWDGPFGDVFDSANGDIFVSNSISNNLSVISGATNTVVGSVSLPFPASYPPTPTYLTMDAANGDVYVADEGNFAVSVVDASTFMNVTAVYEPESGGTFWDSAEGMVLDPNTADLYVSIGDATSNGFTTWDVAQLETSTNTWGNQITTGGSDNTAYNYYPTEGCFDSTNRNVYVPQDNESGDNLPGNVAVISGANQNVVTTIPIGNDPSGCAFDSTNGDVYVIGSGDNFGDSTNNVTVIDPTTNQVVSTIPDGAGDYPTSIAFDTTNGYLYLTGYSGLTVLNGATNEVLGNITLGTDPRFVTIDTANGDLYATNMGNSGAGTVSVISPTGGGGTLESVSVGPSMTTLPTGGNAAFTATPSCSGGPCPAGTTFAWSQYGSSLGTLNSTTGATITYTAGSATGTDELLVTATLDSVSKDGSALITISSGTVSTLASVSLSPSAPSVQVNQSVSISATPTCTSACPSGTVYAWALTNSLGALSSATGASVTFTAGPQAGTVTVFVNATLNSVTKEASAVIAITSQPAGSGSSGTSNGGFLGLPGDDGYLLIGGVIVAAAVVILLLLKKRPS
jgi:DNA-binding beta-propeller fold protein YncE